MRVSLERGFRRLMAIVAPLVGAALVCFLLYAATRDDEWLKWRIFFGYLGLSFPFGVFVLTRCVFRGFRNSEDGTRQRNVRNREQQGGT
jgi:hypothetical protein